MHFLQPARWLLLVALLSNATALHAQSGPMVMPLREAARRSPPDNVAAHLGEGVRIVGIVSAPAVRVLTRTLLPLQHSDGSALTVECLDASCLSLLPGDTVEARGTIGQWAGYPLLRMESWKQLGRQSAPAPTPRQPREVRDGEHLGTLVSLEAKVVSVGDNAGGEFLVVGSRRQTTRLFLPHSPQREQGIFDDLHPGDRVAAVGIVRQYCPVPPFTSGYEVLVAKPEDIRILKRAWIVPLDLFAPFAFLVGVGLLIWYLRERRMARQHRIMSVLNRLGEELLSASGSREITDRCQATLSPTLQNVSVTLYLHQPHSNTLHSVEGQDERASIVELPPIGTEQPRAAAAAQAFQQRRALYVQAPRRSRFFRGLETALSPKTLLFFPLFAQQNLLGVLELRHVTRSRRYRLDERTALQHLANQIAFALRLLQQQTIRDQLHRSEKLAAAGQVISEVAQELRSPVEAVAGLSRLLTRSETAENGMVGKGLLTIHEEAQRALEIVTKLISFSHAEQVPPARVDLHQLLQDVIGFRQREWQALELKIVESLSPQPLYVYAAQSQVEQVMLNLLVYAEHSLTPSKGQLMVETSILGTRAQASLMLGPLKPGAAVEDPLQHAVRSTPGMLQLWRNILQHQGGDLRHTTGEHASARFEVELPLFESMNFHLPGAEGSLRQLTLLLIEPERRLQRQLLVLIQQQGHRAVAVQSGEEANDLLPRGSFDAVLCAQHLSGVHWLAVLDQALQYGVEFVLLVEAKDAELEQTLQERGAHALPRDARPEQWLDVLSKCDKAAAVGPAGRNRNGRTG